jgi:hypothetical protein
MLILILAVVSFIIALLLGSYRIYCSHWQTDELVTHNIPTTWFSRPFRFISFIIVTFLSLFAAWGICVYYNNINIIREYPIISIIIIVSARWLISGAIASYFYFEKRDRFLRNFAATMTTKLQEHNEGAFPPDWRQTPPSSDWTRAILAEVAAEEGIPLAPEDAKAEDDLKAKTKNEGPVEKALESELHKKKLHPPTKRLNPNDYPTVKGTAAIKECHNCKAYATIYENLDSKMVQPPIGAQTVAS